MADIKPTTFRLDENVTAAFKELADKNGFTQTQCLESLINNFELQNAKISLGERKKEVEAFEDYAHKLINLYLNSLELNKNAEDRIREELSKQINLKDNTILNLQENIATLKEELTLLKEQYKELEKNNADVIRNTNSLEQLNKQNKMLLQKNEEQIKMLTDLLTEHKEFKEENIRLKKVNNQLSEKLKEQEHLIKDKDLKIESINEKVDYLKDNIGELKEELTKERANIELIRKDYLDRLEKDKTEIEKSNAQKIDIIQQQFNIKKDRLEIDLNAKYQNELKKMQQTIDKLEKENLKLKEQMKENK